MENSFKMDNADAYPSPRMNARPRRPLAEFNDSPASQSSQTVHQSPPNSQHRESTRMEGSINSPDTSSLKFDFYGASPALFRNEDIQDKVKVKSVKSKISKSKQSEYSKLKNSSNSSIKTIKSTNISGRSIKKSNSVSKKAESSSEDFSEVDDDQPSGSCQFVGESSKTSNVSTSTVHNSPFSSSVNSRKRLNVSKKVPEISNISTASTSKIPVSSHQDLKSKSIMACFGWMIAAALIMVGMIIVMEFGNDLIAKMSSNTQAHDFNWGLTREKFTKELKSLKSKFPHQTNETWKMIAATLKAPMQLNPVYPGVLMLVASSPAISTANCLASELVKIASKAFAQPDQKLPLPDQLLIPAHSLPKLDPHNAKEQLTALLHASLSTWGASAITSVHQLHPITALTLHAFADNTNAPYRHAAIVFTVEDKEDLGSSHMESRVQKLLASYWGGELGEDKVFALISRMVVSVAEVNEETLKVSEC